ncbi:MAG TPA: ATP-binding protein [Sandaracinaceae bacterium LLY-WYZ-13_1]|nr:ATP-binding protein [Sandaracinaceae bacterium LLY-WYZ-13_1]
MDVAGHVDVVRALVVEDSAADAAYLRALLSEQGPPRVATEHASRLGEAIERFERAPYDLVFLDAHLPDSRGTDTLRAMREAIGETPLIVVSGTLEPGASRRAIEAGATLYLAKDELDAESLGRAMRLGRARAADAQHAPPTDVARALHEVGNAVAAIYLPLSTAEDRVADLMDRVPPDGELSALGRELAGDVETARAATEYLRALIGALRRRTGRRGAERADLRPSLSRIARIVRSRFHGGFDLDVPEELPRVAASSTQVEQVLLNLLGNAERALADRPDGHLWLSARRRGDTVALRVRDDGPGIDASLRGSLFDPFVSTRAEAGAGLGLAISRSLAEGWGGTLRLIDGEGPGACFELTLPVAG